MSVRLLVVDDHRELVDVLAQFIARDERGIEITGIAYDGKTAVDLARELKPDVVLLDLILPRLDGVEATRLIREVSPRSRILIFTACDDPSRLMAAIQAGAISVYLKGSGDFPKLLKIIELTHKNVPVLPVDSVPHPPPAQARSPSQALQSLTPAELRVLHLTHNGFDNQRICELLKITPRALANYRSRITNKLGARDWLQAVLLYGKTVEQHGKTTGTM